MKNLISLALILALLPYLTGCSSINQVSKEELLSDNSRHELTIITNQNEMFKFEEGSYFFKSDTLFGIGSKTVADKKVATTNGIAFENIAVINEKETDGLKTALLIAGIIAIVAAVGFVVMMNDVENEIFQIGK